MTVQNKTEIFKPPHMHKYWPPSNTNWKLRQTHKTHTVLCSGRHFEGLLRCALLFLTHRKHMGNFYRSPVICKQAHSFAVCLTLFLTQRTHTQAHTMIKRSEALQGTLGLGAAVNHSYDVVHAFYSDLSGRFGNRAHWWVSWTRQGHSSLPGLSFLLLGHLSSARSLPWAKQWQVGLPKSRESSLRTAGLRQTAGSMRPRQSHTVEQGDMTDRDRFCSWDTVPYVDRKLSNGFHFIQSSLRFVSKSISKSFPLYFLFVHLKKSDNWISLYAEDPDSHLV